MQKVVPNVMNRICIYTKDVQLITGKSERQCREIIKQIRQLKNKEKHQPVTVHDLCDYLGIELQNIIPLVRYPTGMTESYF